MKLAPPSDDPASVLRLWFADALESSAAARAQSQRWFSADPAFDREIAQRFQGLPDRGLAGELDGWQRSPHSCLALVIVLDQLPRNLFRGSSRAFAYDARALEIAEAAIVRGDDAALSTLEASFFYLPLEHAEDLACQGRAVDHLDALTQRCETSLLPLHQQFADYARRHREVIARFGRFPHRNEVLGRTATADESVYLASGGETFGPG